MPCGREWTRDVDDSTGHGADDHGESHGEHLIHDHADPQPSVFSHSFTLEFNRKLAGTEIIDSLSGFVEDLNRWVHERGTSSATSKSLPNAEMT